MELHTLGADGGYTEEDVLTLALTFTGWRVNRPDAREFPDHATVFEGARHDFSPKVLLGHLLRSRGKAEGGGGPRHPGEEPRDGSPYQPSNWRNISLPTSLRRHSSRGLPCSGSGDRWGYPGGAQGVVHQ